jgi:hypothetical protein
MEEEWNHGSVPEINTQSQTSCIHHDRTTVVVCQTKYRMPAETSCGSRETETGEFVERIGQVRIVHFSMYCTSTIQSNPIQSNPIQSNPIQSNPIQSIGSLEMNFGTLVVVVVVWTDHIARIDASAGKSACLQSFSPSDEPTRYIDRLCHPKRMASVFRVICRRVRVCIFQVLILRFLELRLSFLRTWIQR